MNLINRIFPKAPKPAQRLQDVTYTDNPTIERMVFICGLHRSGTTLLERLLAAQFDVSYLRASVPESEGQHMQSVYKPAYCYGGPGKFAFSQPARDEIASLCDFANHRDVITQEWRNFVVGSSDVLLEKSPPNLTKMAWLRQVFPGCQFVIMSRDPRAVASATQKWSKTSLPELVMHWNAAYSSAMSEFDASDCTLLRYEDLVDDAPTELARLARFLNLSPRDNSESLEERHQNLVNTNAKYIEHHEGAIYGAGIWDRLGYTI